MKAETEVLGNRLAFSASLLDVGAMFADRDWSSGIDRDEGVELDALGALADQNTAIPKHDLGEPGE